ncbi:MAG: hypothetical protein JST02_10770, partial [Bacteroidetes bacterium]|nr:hypothetical protein [Bacteroidota bacterium]
MKQSIVYFLFFLISSCRTNRGLVNDDYFLLRFRENFFYANHNIVQDYSMRIPKGGNLTKGNYDLTGDYHIEYRIAYLDSSILYIGNSNWSGSKLNTVNRVEAGIIGINKKNENDTL